MSRLTRHILLATLATVLYCLYVLGQCSDCCDVSLFALSGNEQVAYKKAQPYSLSNDGVIYLTFYDYESKSDEYVSKSLVGPDGKVVRTNMPLNLYIRNTGGSDGLGLCVFTSIYHTGVYQGLPFYDFRKYMERKPGGGWPEKVDRMVSEYCRAYKYDVPNYVHVYGLKSIDVIELAIRRGHMVCITWGTDYSHYGGQTIAHMVNCVYLDKDWGAIVDNNFPNEVLWVRRKTFEKYAAWTGRLSQDGLWAIIFFDNPMPVKLMASSFGGRQ